MSVRRSASGDIARPFSRSAVLIKASIGLAESVGRSSVLIPPGRPFAGGCLTCSLEPAVWKSLSGRTDQCCARVSEDAARSASFSGQTAPDSIHALRVATSSFDKGLPSGGIRVSSSMLVTRWKRGESAAFPETIAGPSCPPLNANSFASRRSSPFCFFAPWHSTQRCWRSGRICVSKDCASSPRRLPGGNRRPRTEAVRRRAFMAGVGLLSGAQEKGSGRLRPLWRPWVRVRKDQCPRPLRAHGCASGCGPTRHFGFGWRLKSRRAVRWQGVSPRD